MSDDTPRTRDRLTVEAARLFAERGYHGTSVNDLATALGIHKSSVYAHIKGKQELLAEVALSGAQAFHAALDAVPDDVSAEERLRLALRAHLRVVHGQLDVATVWLQEWRYLTGDPRETFVTERHRYEQRVRRLLRDAVAAGALRPDLDVRHATLLFFSAGNWAYTWLNDRSSIDRVASAFWKLLHEGMAAR